MFLMRWVFRRIDAEIYDKGVIETLHFPHLPSTECDISVHVTLSLPDGSEKRYDRPKKEEVL